ncbi:MAG: polyphosphate polymerase domain-containing protein [Chloroflexi bacterium]|nr:MAG: polyphosphate polymerase domain-containing protein [Chloroflexota bacterium]
MTTDLPPAARYEIKMAYELGLLPELHSWIHSHPAGFGITYPPRQVNSVYMDTPDLNSLHDHLSGIPLRRKLRFRWYGEDLTKAQGTTEVKNKSERVGWKITQSVDCEFDLAGMSWDEIMNGLRTNTTGLIYEMLCVARPVVLTVYFREYYVSGDGLVRLTLDTDLRAYDQLMSARPNIWFPQPLEQPVIVELKSDTENATSISDILSHFPIRANRYSKYMTNLSMSLIR